MSHLSYATQGRKAFKAGISFANCPHEVGTRARSQWRGGWNAENAAANPNLAKIPSVKEFNENRTKVMAS